MSNTAADKAAQDSGQRVFSLEELRGFDGNEGRSGYIAINGIVYDITDVHLFREGKHHGVTAGNDVSKLFVHKPAILNRLRIVGTLA